MTSKRKLANPGFFQVLWSALLLGRARETDLFTAPSGR